MTTETTVVNCITDEYDVYIGRPSKWGNPFPSGNGRTRSEAIAEFEEYARNNEELLASLHELDGKRLGCYCAPQSCHGDVYVKLRREQKINQLLEY